MVALAPEAKVIGEGIAPMIESGLAQFSRGVATAGLFATARRFIHDPEVDRAILGEFDEEIK